MHNYISLIHENIKSRLLLCSEVHFAATAVGQSILGQAPGVSVIFKSSGAGRMGNRYSTLAFFPGNVQMVLES